MIPSHCEYNLLAANLSIWEDRSGVGDSLSGRWKEVVEGLGWAQQGTRGKTGIRALVVGRCPVSWARDLHPELLSKVGDAWRTGDVRIGREKKGALETRERTYIY